MGSPHGICYHVAAAKSILLLKINPFSRGLALFIRMFDGAHFSCHIGKIDQVGMGITTGQYEVDSSRLAPHEVEDIVDIEQTERDRGILVLFNRHCAAAAVYKPSPS